MNTESSFIVGIGQLCGRSVPDVLETMFFAMAVESQDAQVGGDSMRVHLDFRGSPSGTFTLHADRPALAQLGAAFLGNDNEELSPAEVGDVACELANILCGSVLSEAESESGFELDEPRLEPPAAHSASPLHRSPPDYQARFQLDNGGALEIGFLLESSPRAGRE